ncbi:MAG: GTP 3',8-cyclase MoaA [Chloroflexi bacterium]|nr:GTP 3',8-cyclase MoaA [Chloroflexota bacterium]
MTGLSDSFQRPINYLRISVTDRCNLRCVYCMPPGGIALMAHQDILSYEEIHRVVEASAELGINKVRLTGGEPLVRADLTGLIRMLSDIKAIDDISLTTNGMLLARHAAELKAAGLRRVNISLDTLDPEKFRRMTRGGRLDTVLEGIEAARASGLNPVKINTVVIAGENDDEIGQFALKTVRDGWHVRFIERMPFNNHDREMPAVPAKKLREYLEPFGELTPASTVGNGPARYFRLPGATGTVGFITPVSEHFCTACNRLRLTADGRLRPCLLSDDEIDLRPLLRGGTDSASLKRLIQQAAACKPARHHLAEGSVPQSRPFSQVGG